MKLFKRLCSYSRALGVLMLAACPAASPGQTIYVPGGSVGTSSNGSVGIGTSSPSAKLHVSGGGLDLDVNQIIRTYPTSVGGVAMGLTLWSADTSTAGEIYGRPGFIGRGLYWSGNQFVAASTNSNWNWGTVTGMMATKDDVRFVTRAASEQGFDYGLGSNLDSISRMTVTTSGNVGIGTTNPDEKLSVAGNVSIGGGYLALRNAVGGTAYAVLQTENNDLNFRVFGSNGWRDALRIDGDSGNVGIGTTTPSHQLSVNGTVRAKEVIIEASPWPDDVFADDYRLIPLSEVAAHIDAEGHLPGVPNAATVVEQGAAVAEMQTILLRKIEEMTLYVIELERKNADLQKRLESEDAELRIRLEKLEHVE